MRSHLARALHLSYCVDTYQPTEKDIRRAARTYAHLFHGPSPDASARESTRSEENWIRLANETWEGRRPDVRERLLRASERMRTKLVSHFLRLDAELHRTDGAPQAVAAAYPDMKACVISFEEMAANWRAWRAKS